jgi:hypothetical protein
VVVTYSKDKATLPSSLEEERGEGLLGHNTTYYYCERGSVLRRNYLSSRAGKDITMIFFAPHFFRGFTRHFEFFAQFRECVTS